MPHKLDIPEEDVEWLYYEEGNTQQEIADFYNVTRSCIISRLRPKEIKERLNQFQREHKEETILIRNVYRREHKDEIKYYNIRYQKEHKEQLNLYLSTGLQGLRHKIRVRDNQNKQYRWLKSNLCRDTHIHHEWIPETSDYKFSALVDASEHLHGIIKPIIILQDNRIELLQEF